ncbi:MAG TPA: nucleotidyl transferase AbiEii/AbiGii toxin family protein [Myxococcota bacterium]|nr:nucleotidyl transferase AbiEii/AbiGii toxin family protein [Myxococcota bacterium]
MRLAEVLAKVTADLSELGVPAALVGGLAVSHRVEPRFTRDADLAVAVPSDSQAEELIFQLQQRGYRIAMVLEQTELGRMSTVRLIPPAGTVEGIVVDLLFASCGIEAEVVQDAEVGEVFPGLFLPVARVGHLLAMKLLSHDPRRRPQDSQDIVGLLTRINAEENRRCEEAIRMIHSRGFHRNRDLFEAWHSFTEDR